MAAAATEIGLRLKEERGKKKTVGTAQHFAKYLFVRQIWTEIWLQTIISRVTFF